MDIADRGSNTWDAMLPRLRGVPAADSRVIDVVILSGVFLATAPLMLLYLSRASGRPFLEMARSLIDSAKQQDRRAASARRSK